MPLEPEPLTLQHKTGVSDGAGGKIYSWEDVWTASGTVNFFQRLTWQHLEQGTHNSEGPGIQSLQLRLFTFEQPWPDPIPKVEDRFQRTDGSRWVVQNVRPYEDTLQVDAEQVI